MSDTGNSSFDETAPVADDADSATEQMAEEIDLSDGNVGGDPDLDPEGETRQMPS